MLLGDSSARCGLSACESLLGLILQAILLLTFCSCYLLKALFVILVYQLPYSTELWRYCPGCVNFMHGKHTDWFSVRKLVWNQHICEHDSPWSLSVINYLCTEDSQETISKDKLLCISIFSSLKEMWVLSIYVDAFSECQTGEAVWLRKEEEEIGKKKKKERKASESFSDVRLMWYHADRACWVCVLVFCLLSFSCCCWTTLI